MSALRWSPTLNPENFLAHLEQRPRSPPPPRQKKRPRDDDIDGSNSSSDDVVKRAAKRSRLMASATPRVVMIEAPAIDNDDEVWDEDGEGADDDDDDDDDDDEQTTVDGAADGGAPPAAGTGAVVAVAPAFSVYTTLDVAARRVHDTDMVGRFQPGMAMPHDDCFLCHYQERDRNGKSYDRTELYGFALFQHYYATHPNLPDERKAKDLCRIYRKYVYEPACMRNGGITPANLPLPSERTFYEHIRMYTRDPMAKQLMCMETLERVMNVVNAHLLVGGIVDDKLLRYASTIPKDLAHMWDTFGTRYGAQAASGAMALDPRNVLAFAPTAPLEHLVRKAARGIGGATATDTDAVISHATAQRRHYGTLADSEEDDEPDAMVV